MEELAPLKSCTKCGVEKELDQFYSRIQAPDGYASRCKPCLISYHRARYRTEHGKAVTRKSQLKKYGITPEQFQAMVVYQNGKCANSGCNNPGTYVDHNHETGKVRALLCNGCNLAFGMLKEDQPRIAGLLAYAKDWS